MPILGKAESKALTADPWNVLNNVNAPYSNNNNLDITLINNDIIITTF